MAGDFGIAYFFRMQAYFMNISIETNAGYVMLKNFLLADGYTEDGSGSMTSPDFEDPFQVNIALKLTQASC